MLSESLRPPECQAMASIGGARILFQAYDSVRRHFGIPTSLDEDASRRKLVCVCVCVWQSWTCGRTASRRAQGGCVVRCEFRATRCRRSSGTCGRGTPIGCTGIVLSWAPMRSSCSIRSRWHAPKCCGHPAVCAFTSSPLLRNPGQSTRKRFSTKRDKRLRLAHWIARWTPTPSAAFRPRKSPM